MKDYSKCLDACDEATAADTEKKHTREIEEASKKCMVAMYSARDGETEEETMARIQRDPELVSIISDPIMQSILQQAKQNPQALNEHMKNPMIGTKIRKLMAAGKPRAPHLPILMTFWQLTLRQVSSGWVERLVRVDGRLAMLDGRWLGLYFSHAWFSLHFSFLCCYVMPR
jgi:hypothetical protein